MKYTGDTRTFVVINTTEYNNDGRWCIQTAGFADLPELGFDEEAVKRIEQIGVGSMLDDFDFYGVIVIRIA